MSDRRPIWDRVSVDVFRSVLQRETMEFERTDDTFIIKVGDIRIQLDLEAAGMLADNLNAFLEG